MFIKLERADVYSISGQNGRDEPMGIVYINSNDVSHIDGNAVVVGNFVFCCNLSGIKKVLSALGLEGAE